MPDPNPLDAVHDTRVHLAAVAALVVDLYGTPTERMAAQSRQKMLDGLRDFVLKVSEEVAACEGVVHA